MMLDLGKLHQRGFFGMAVVGRKPVPFPCAARKDDIVGHGFVDLKHSVQKRGVHVSVDPENDVHVLGEILGKFFFRG